MKRFLLTCLAVVFSLVLFALPVLASEVPSTSDNVVTVQPDATPQQVEPVTVDTPERSFELAVTEPVTDCSGVLQVPIGLNNDADTILSDSTRPNYTLNAETAHTENAKAPQGHVILLWSIHRSHSEL